MIRAAFVNVVRPPVHGVNADSMFPDGQMIAKDQIKLTGVPAAFSLYLPEAIPTTCSTASFIFTVTPACIYGGFAMCNIFKVEIIIEFAIAI